MGYDKKLKEKVLLVKRKSNLTIVETANLFEVAKSTIQRWLKRTENLKQTGRPRKLCLEVLKADVEKYPDAYQYERAERLGVKQNTICYGLEQLEISYKKKPYTPAGGRGKAYFISEKD